MKTKSIRPIKGRWPEDFLQKQLKTLVANLLACLQKRGKTRQDLLEFIETSKIPLDDAEKAYILKQQDYTIIISTWTILMEAEIRKAIDKIKSDLSLQGSHKYGKCTSCQKPITAVRLEAYPSAVRCINCQRSVETTIEKAVGRN